ncbi:MAG TPA: STAS domain-containing protein [Thermodesulfovibrionales bacterium]|nr:STAS domain-containing protein [Thermodesulfovibrionales bacterium]
MSGTIAFKDRLTINEVSGGMNALKATLASCDEVVVDATGVREIDVSAVQLLIAVKKECSRRGKKLILNTSDAVGNLMTLFGIPL